MIRKLLILFLFSIAEIGYSTELDPSTIISNIVSKHPIISIALNLMLYNGNSEYLIDNEHNWINYSLQRSNLSYYSNGKDILYLSWGDISKVTNRISSNDIGFEIIFSVENDENFHYIIQSNIAGMESILEKYFQEPYIYYNNVYYPDICKNDYRDLAMLNTGYLSALLEQAKTMGFYSYVIYPGMFSDPISRQEPSYGGLSPEIVTAIKAKYKVDYPIKGYWYDLYLTGVIEERGYLYWGFILNYPDNDLQENDYETIKAHLKSWQSLRFRNTGFSNYVELNEANIEHITGLTYSRFKFLDNKSNAFWYREILNRSIYF